MNSLFSSLLFFLSIPSLFYGNQRQGLFSRMVTQKRADDNMAFRNVFSIDDRDDEEDKQRRATMNWTTNNGER